MPREPVLLQPVLEIWREVLGHQCAALTADSNLFLSGGDSLDLLRILVRMRERLGVELELHEVAQFSTPRKMACIGAGATAAPAARHPPAVARGDGPHLSGMERFPCTSGQTALWFAEQASGASGVYNAAVVLHLTGQLDVPALEHALHAVLLRHEILRTRLQFDAGAQQLFAIVDPAPAVQLEPAAMSVRAARRHLASVAAEPFDLEDGPLWRFHLVTPGPRRWSLLLCVHHVVTDAWSGSVLVRHLADAYNAALDGVAWHPEVVEREFRDFCLQPPAVPPASWSWWRSYLGGADQLRSWPPTTNLRWPFAMACEERALEPHVFQRVRAATRSGACLPSAFYLSALRLALRAFTGIDELCIGMPVNIRNTSLQEEGIGYFVNLLVTRECIANMDARSVLQTVEQVLRDLLSRRTSALSDLARELQPTLLPSGNPWCDILFAFRNPPATAPAFTGLQAALEAVTPALGQYPLKVEFIHADAACICRIEYARELLTPAGISALHAELAHQTAGLATLVFCNN